MEVNAQCLTWVECLLKDHHRKAPPPQGGPQGPAPVDTSQLLEMLSQMPPETKLSPEEVARFIMGDLPVNMPQGGGPPMPQGGGMQ